MSLNMNSPSGISSQISSLISTSQKFAQSPQIRSQNRSETHCSSNNQAYQTTNNLSKFHQAGPLALARAISSYENTDEIVGSSQVQSHNSSISSQHQTMMSSNTENNVNSFQIPPGFTLVGPNGELMSSGGSFSGVTAGIPHGMRPQRMPTQGMAPQAMFTQGMAPQGMPSQGMVPQGMHTQGMAPQAMPIQRIPPQFMTPQGMRPQRMPPSGILYQGNPQYGMHQQYMRPQQMVSQEMHHQGMSPQHMRAQGAPMPVIFPFSSPPSSAQVRRQLMRNSPRVSSPIVGNGNQKYTPGKFTVTVNSHSDPQNNEMTLQSNNLDNSCEDETVHDAGSARNEKDGNDSSISSKSNTNLAKKYGGPSGKNNNSKKGPKKPLNAYLLWCSQNRKKIVEANKGANMRTINILCGEVWHKMSKEEKKPFTDEAAKQMAEYQKIQMYRKQNPEPQNPSYSVHSIREEVFGKNSKVGKGDDMRPNKMSEKAATNSSHQQIPSSHIHDLGSNAGLAPLSADIRYVI